MRVLMAAILAHAGCAGDVPPAAAQSGGLCHPGHSECFTAIDTADDPGVDGAAHRAPVGHTGCSAADDLTSAQGLVSTPGGQVLQIDPLPLTVHLAGICPTRCRGTPGNLQALARGRGRGAASRCEYPVLTRTFGRQPPRGHREGHHRDRWQRERAARPVARGAAF